jgi:hypothetical protein
MKIRLTASEFCLANREVLDLDDAMGVRIDALMGAVWVTQERDRRDLVLNAGESCTIERPGRTVVQALASSRVSVQAPHTQPAEKRGIVDTVVGAVSRLRHAAPGLAWG